MCPCDPLLPLPLYVLAPNYHPSPLLHVIFATGGYGGMKHMMEMEHGARLNVKMRLRENLR